VVEWSIPATFGLSVDRSFRLWVCWFDDQLVCGQSDRCFIDIRICPWTRMFVSTCYGITRPINDAVSNTEAREAALILYKIRRGFITNCVMFWLPFPDLQSSCTATLRTYLRPVLSSHLIYKKTKVCYFLWPPTETHLTFLIQSENFVAWIIRVVRVNTM
jgi:hypothetical protein